MSKQHEKTDRKIVSWIQCLYHFHRVYKKMCRLMCNSHVINGIRNSNWFICVNYSEGLLLSSAFSCLSQRNKCMTFDPYCSFICLFSWSKMRPGRVRFFFLFSLLFMSECEFDSFWKTYQDTVKLCTCVVWWITSLSH